MTTCCKVGAISGSGQTDDRGRSVAARKITVHARDISEEFLTLPQQHTFQPGSMFSFLRDVRRKDTSRSKQKALRRAIYLVRQRGRRGQGDIPAVLLTTNCTHDGSRVIPRLHGYGWIHLSTHSRLNPRPQSSSVLVDVCHIDARIRVYVRLIPIFSDGR